MKKCIMCGSLFEPKTNAQRICERKHYRSCAFCGTPFEIKRPSDSKNCCSKECTIKLREATMVERFGVPQALKNKDLLHKAEETCVERFGYKHPSQSPDIKERVKQQFIDKYGVSSPFETDDFKQKSKDTCLRKYGVAYTSQIPGRTEKMQETNLRRYGSTYPIGNPDIHNKAVSTMQSKYGVPYYCMTDDCRSKQRQTISSYNKHIIDILSNVGIESYPEKVHIDRYSYDIFVPSQNTVIEINPTVTHNSIKNPWSDVGLQKDYHKVKTELARINGYKCINLWDWDNADKVINMLLPKKTIYARNCIVTKIHYRDAVEFENINHIQGSVRAQKLCFGLLYNGELVQVMTFGKSRYARKFDFELLRLCSKHDVIVVGGASKLWCAFISEVNPKSVISYCDLSKFSGGVYEKFGMKLDHISEPNKIWSKYTQSITNNLLLQRGYDQLFGTNYGRGTSNSQLMLDSGWLPVYDCGQAVYTYFKK